ncbi:MAG: phytanoyl-CoA dioxygenase family protein [Aestuariivita sp.]|uniref:phytanoyl-CoA dioxygenase family protein n=1 Tax=Aestuariivita sp. TaxID=1872407 RepID=UPI003BB0DE09
MALTVQTARDAAEQYHEEGYAIVRQFVDGDALAALQAETARMYDEGLKHHATFRHGNLAFEILPEQDFQQRYVIQAYWMSWISSYFEQFRRSQSYFTLLEPFLGRDIKQVAQQIHWKPPGAGLTGYRWHQDLRFRPKRDAFRDIETSSVTVGLAVDPSTRENGCLQVVPGSHKLGYLGLSDEGDGQIMKGVSADDQLRAVGLDPADVVWLELEPGDLAIWGLMTVHGSLPNTSDQDRAFALSSYVRADTTDRGEWAFRDGVSTPLGDTPSLCKFEALHERPEPHYVTDKWYD